MAESLPDDGDTVIACLEAMQLEEKQELLSEDSEVPLIKMTEFQRKAKVMGRLIADDVPLIRAVEDCDAELVKRLVKEGCDVNKSVSCMMSSGNAESNVTSLHFAVQFDNPDIVDVLIEAGANVNARTNSKIAPLHVAVQLGSLIIVKKLIGAKANVNIKDNEKNTSLHFAVSYHALEIAETLIESGADVNIKGPDNSTALHLAAESGDLEIVKLLILKGANIDAKKTAGCTALHLAIKERHWDVAEFLILAGADVKSKGKDGWTAMHYMFHNLYNPEISNLLVSKGAKVNVKEKDGKTPLHIATISTCASEAVAFLVQHGARVHEADNSSWTALHYAASLGDFEKVKILCDSGAEIDAEAYAGITALHTASDFWHVNVVKFLVERGANVNQSSEAKWTPLHFSAEASEHIGDPQKRERSSETLAADRLEVVKILIGKGANVNAQSCVGSTPLHLAANAGDPLLCKYLLDSGAYYDVTYDAPLKDKSVLDCAIDGGNEKVLHLLKMSKKLIAAVRKADVDEIKRCIENEAVVNCRSTKYETPLMCASWKGYANIVNVLLENNADVNLCNSTGFGPMHYALKFRHYDIMLKLLAHGGIFNSVTQKGKTLLSFAEDSDNDKAVNFIHHIEKYFEDVENDDWNLIDLLKDLRDNKPDEFLAAVNCKNAEGKTLSQVALHYGHSGLASEIINISSFAH